MYDQSKPEQGPNVATDASQFQTRNTTLHYIVGRPRKGNGVRALGALVFQIIEELNVCLFRYFKINVFLMNVEALSERSVVYFKTV